MCGIDTMNLLWLLPRVFACMRVSVSMHRASSRRPEFALEDMISKKVDTRSTDCVRMILEF